MEQYVSLDVSLKETSLCVYQTGTTLAVADTILWPAARGRRHYAKLPKGYPGVCFKSRSTRSNACW